MAPINIKGHVVQNTQIFRPLQVKEIDVALTFVHANSNPKSNFIVVCLYSQVLVVGCAVPSSLFFVKEGTFFVRLHNKLGLSMHMLLLHLGCLPM